ncbi:MAG: hypothetical protein M1827_007183 [Pycnora praestabilis]|nr:MAG: hypothetical protein M1827_007183 [Pycnora praestabilis]
MAFGDFPLKDKIAVVTGGGSGISLAFAKLAAAHGAKIIIADLRLHKDAEDFEKENKSVIFEKCDVTKWADLHNLITVSQKEFGDVPDVYIGGAGVFEPPWSNFWDDTETERYAEVDININHPIKLTRIAMRALLSKDKKGVVLSLASGAGLQGIYPTPLYCATKHALVGFTKSMEAADRLEGVKVVTICPGIVKTPLWTENPEKLSQFSYNDDMSITPEACAQCMLEAVVEGKYPGGTVLEVNKAGQRVIPKWNIDPPAHAVSSTTAGSTPRGSPEWGYEPILEKMKKERGVPL